MAPFISKLFFFVSHYRVVVLSLAGIVLLIGATSVVYFAYYSPKNTQITKDDIESHDTTRENPKSISDVRQPSDVKKSTNEDKATPKVSEKKSANQKTGTSKPAEGNSKSNSTSSTSAPEKNKSPKPAPVAESKCPVGQSGAYPNCTVLPPSPLGIPGDWSLIMRDEFNGSSLGSQWATQRGPSWSYGDPYNPSLEDAFYLPNNPKVQDGNLVLALNQGATNGYPYSSGMVQNGRSWNYKYGYVEARVKVPGDTGVWPAFWTLPAPVDAMWPPEIDIFEFGLSSQTRPSFNYHYSSPGHQQSGLTVYGNSGIDYTKNYHVYGMLWNAQKIQVFIDGEPGPSYTNAAHITSVPQYIIFNLALKKGYTPSSGTAMYVDYVRVWQ